MLFGSDRLSFRMFLPGEETSQSQDQDLPPTWASGAGNEKVAPVVGFLAGERDGDGSGIRCNELIEIGEKNKRQIMS